MYVCLLSLCSGSVALLYKSPTQISPVRRKDVVTRPDSVIRFGLKQASPIAHLTGLSGVIGAAPTARRTRRGL